MGVAAVAGAGVVGLLVGVWVGRSHAPSRRPQDARPSTAGTDEDLERQTQASAEATQVRDQILASMQDGVLLFDGGWRTVFANRAIERHLGRARRPWSRSSRPASARAIQRAAETEQVEVAEIETGAPTRWLRVTATPTGTDGSVLAVIADVTEARRLDAVRRDFVANASHELKTPAASIQAAAETLLHVWQEDPDAVPRFAEQLEREAVRLSRIVADLLDLSRLESGSELQDQVHLDALVREETSRLEGAATEAGLTVDVEAATVPVVRGSDARPLAAGPQPAGQRRSATRRTPARSWHPSRRTTGPSCSASRDTGTGIPSKELARVFERFYRVDRARSRETGGTGLGLAIVRHVAENHGGTVTVESELGRGSTFEVRLPAAIPGGSETG